MKLFLSLICYKKYDSEPLIVVEHEEIKDLIDLFIDRLSNAYLKDKTLLNLKVIVYSEGFSEMKVTSGSELVWDANEKLGYMGNVKDYCENLIFKAVENFRYEFIE